LRLLDEALAFVGQPGQTLRVGGHPVEIRDGLRDRGTRVPDAGGVGARDGFNGRHRLRLVGDLDAKRLLQHVPLTRLRPVVAVFPRGHRLPLDSDRLGQRPLINLAGESCPLDRLPHSLVLR
jgi:hypothetical protein